MHPASLKERGSPSPPRDPDDSVEDGFVIVARGVPHHHHHHHHAERLYAHRVACPPYRSLLLPRSANATAPRVTQRENDASLGAGADSLVGKLMVWVANRAEANGPLPLGAAGVPPGGHKDDHPAAPAVLGEEAFASGRYHTGCLESLSRDAGV